MEDEGPDVASAETQRELKNPSQHLVGPAVHVDVRVQRDLYEIRFQHRQVQRLPKQRIAASESPSATHVGDPRGQLEDGK